VRGDDQLNEAKLATELGTPMFRAATADEILPAMGARPGSLGVVTSTRKDSSIKVYADEALRGARGMTTGAAEDGYHLRHVEIERDIKVDAWADLRTVRAGELSVESREPLKIQRAIEVGHVFKLGTKYSEPLNATFLDTDGSRKPCIMGCYGIGLTRTLQAIIEQSNDKDGIIWPKSVAPCTVCITPLGVAPDSAIMKAAEEIYSALVARGLDVILDDRDERPGVKFKDADLIGFPIRVGIGEKSLAKGEVEIKVRGGDLVSVKKEQAIERVLELAR
jgi:prolyl-tRNA synthetase